MASMNGGSEEPSKVYKRKSFKGKKNNVLLQRGSGELGGGDLMKRQKLCDDGGGKFGFLGEESRVTISLGLKSKKEVRECRRKLQGELNLVRIWMSKIEGKKERDGMDVGDLDEGGNKKKRVRSEVESGPLNQLSVSVVENSQGGIESMGKGRDEVDVGGSDGVKKKRSEVEGRQLSVSVLENNQGGIESVGKEKRTPKANQFYRNSEFLLGKDKFPVDKKLRGSGKKQGGGGKDKIPSEGKDKIPLVDKKLKGSGKKQGGEGTDNIPSVAKKSKGSGKNQGGGDVGFGLQDIKSQLLQNCKGLLQRLMKHKHGWVFNVPVDAEALGLHDYFDIIKMPMDLGTVKSKLNKNFYQSPMEFMMDVKLTFQNAMTYNPKGQDVYVMAEQMLQIFEEKWAVIEADYVEELKLVDEREAILTAPTSKKAHTPRQPPLETERALERSESPTPSADLNTKLVNLGHPGRPAAPKKPKARDPNKREMTYEEKQKLSLKLQTLPAEKLESVVAIIKKRNSSLCQHDDDIEVDINSFDTETLWELDRFLINYNRNLSKNKKNDVLANNAMPAVERSDHSKNAAPVVDLVEESSKEINTDNKANQTKNTTRASKPSGSSSISGSTSTDSGSSIHQGRI